MRTKIVMSEAVALAASLFRREQGRAGSRMNAYHAIGSKIGMSARWVRKLLAGRVNGIDAAIRDRLHALLVAELETEIKRLSHELEMVRASRSQIAIDQVGQIEAHLAKARELLNADQ